MFASLVGVRAALQVDEGELRVDVVAVGIGAASLQRPIDLLGGDDQMDPQVLTNRVEQGEYQQQVLRQRKRAVDAGVSSTPTVLVNGHFVKTRTQQCLNAFIEQAQSGTLGASASK